MPQLIRVLFNGASARVVLEPSHAAWLGRQLLHGTIHPSSHSAAAKIKAVVQADAPKITFDTGERAALLVVLAAQRDELKGELLLLYQELRDEARHEDR